MWYYIDFLILTCLPQLFKTVIKISLVSKINRNRDDVAHSHSHRHSKLFHVQLHTNSYHVELHSTSLYNHFWLDHNLFLFLRWRAKLLNANYKFP